MNRKTGFRIWSILVILLFHGAWGATVTGTSSSTAYTAAGDDLLQSGLVSAESTLTLYRENYFINGTLETLTDGSAAPANNNNVYALSGGAVVYTLDTALHPSGYTITSVTTYSGWKDTGRVNQHYEVSFRMVGSNTFENTVTVSYTGTNTQTRVEITDLNLAGIEAVKFTFLSQQNGGVGYKELDVFGSACSNVYTCAGVSGGEAYSVAADDLLQTALDSTQDALTYYTETGFSNAGVAALADGVFGSASKTNGTCGIAGGSVTYTLDTVSSPAGYLISGVESYSGWDNANRDDQRYMVSFREVGAFTFGHTVTIDYTGTVSQTHVSLSGLAIPHVEAVRFTFPTQENGGAGYKELDVLGSPSVYTNVVRLSAESQTIVSNAAANVRVMDGEGASGTLALSDAVTAVDTLTCSATGGVVTLDPAGRTLAVNRILTASDASGLAVGTGSANGGMQSQGAVLYVQTAGTNETTVRAAVANGGFSSSLVKSGSGILVFEGANTYTGDTVARAGTLRFSGSGAFIGGALLVSDGHLLIEGGTVYPKREVIFTNTVVTQTAGTFKANNNILNQNGTLTFSGGISYAGSEQYLGWNSTNTTAVLGGSHTADWHIVRFGSGAVSLSLQAGSTLYADRLYSAGAAGSLLFNGGVLSVSSQEKALATNGWIGVSSGTLTAGIQDGGAILDTTYGDAFIRHPLVQDGASSGGLTKTGTNTLTLASLCSYAGDTVVAAGTLKLQPLPLLINTGFESPSYSSAGWSYLSSDGLTGGWSMSGSRAGIARNGAPWVTTAPEGLQIAFLQMVSYIKQNFSLMKAQAVTLSFQAANRPNYPPDRVEVQIDGVSKAVWPAEAFTNSAVFKTYSADLGVLAAGTHELSFVGSQPDSADRATAIDDIHLGGPEDLLIPGTLPASTRLTVASGAIVDLDGSSQTLAELNGSGRVVNSAGNDAVLTVGGNNASTNFAGTIEGAVSLVKTGTGTWTLSGANTCSNTTQILAGTLRFSTILPVFINAGFEEPALTGSSSYVYVTSDGLSGGWTMSSSFAGIARNSSPWITTAPEGVQGAYLQKGSYMWQTLNVPRAGAYQFSFSAAGRPNYKGADQVELRVDSTPVASWATNAFTTDGTFTTYSTNLVLSVGLHEFRFVGSSPDDVDRATIIDDVQLEYVGGLYPGALPEGNDIEIAAGAVLDLNGSRQTLSSLSGGGLVTNGTLAVTGVIAPGGTNVVGTLTVAASVELSGTLLIDTALDGTCDLLSVQGALNLDGATLQIQDLGLLKKSATYVIAQCSPGELSGRFASANLGTQRSIAYDTADGRVLLVNLGTLFFLQ